MTEGQKEYKKLRPPLLLGGRWVGLLKGNSSNTILKKMMHGEISKAPSNHPDGWPYGGPDSPKTKKIQRDKSRVTTETLHIAATTSGQLRALEGSMMPQEGMERLSKTSTSETNPEEKT